MRSNAPTCAPSRAPTARWAQPPGPAFSARGQYPPACPQKNGARPAFAALARRLELAPHLRLGRTEQQSGGAAKDSILSNAMEAVVGAIYLDGGLQSARDFVRRVYADALREGAPRVEGDSKTRFQEAVMASRGEFPRYELERDSGVEGDEARFISLARVADEVWGRGSGRTKQAAEFSAAVEGLKRLGAETGDRG